MAYPNDIIDDIHRDIEKTHFVWPLGERLKCYETTIKDIEGSSNHEVWVELNFENKTIHIRESY